MSKKTFGELNPGDVFMMQGYTYIKTKELECIDLWGGEDMVNAVWLEGGEHTHVMDHFPVIIPFEDQSGEIPAFPFYLK